MPLSLCDVDHCSNVSVRTPKGSCELCDRHLCINHLQPNYHRCPTWESDATMRSNMLATATKAELSTLFSRINVIALQSRAQSLRRGINCTIPSLEIDGHGSAFEMGGMNIHIPIYFADGITWLCRIRRKTITTLPTAHQSLLICNEAETYRFLATTKIPVPEIFDYAVEPLTNPVGVGYILMQKMEGTPLSNHSINDPAVLNSVVDQLADIYIELKHSPFSSIGCLTDSVGFTLGPLLESSTVDVLTTGDIGLMGPFTSSSAYRTAFIQHQINLIARGETYPDNPVDAYLVYRYVLDNSMLISQYEGRSTSYYLKHMDDKGDHILVNDQFKIVAIIDWEWAQTTTKAFAFAAPLYFLDVGAYYDGDNSLSPRELLLASAFEKKGHADLATCVHEGRLSHRLTHCVGGDGDDPESHEVLFQSLRDQVGLEKPLQSYAQWRAQALKRYAEDPVLKGICQRGQYLV